METDEKKCPQCAETIKAEAKVCRFCGHSFENDVSPSTGGPPLSSKSTGRGKGCLTALAVILALAILGSLLGGGNETAPSSSVASGEVAADAGTPGSASEAMPVAEEPDDAPSVGLFGPEANAARSAKQYLSMTGFSRRGLIEQLSSDAGEGYDVAHATAAVDSLNTDWNEQAVRSAKQYLKMTGFSCSGLIEQLSSDAGEKYTKAQARHGAQQAGAC